MSKISIVKEAAEKAIAAESDRTTQLLRKADMFAAGTIAVIAYQLLDITMLVDSVFRVRVSCYLSLATLCFSLFFAFYSMRVKGYRHYPRGDKLWENLKSENVSDEAAEQAVIQLLLKTREQNAKLNDAKSGWLFWCGSLFFAGIMLVMVSRLLAALAIAFPNTIL